MKSNQDESRAPNKRADVIPSSVNESLFFTSGILVNGVNQPQLLNRKWKPETTTIWDSPVGNKNDSIWLGKKFTSNKFSISLNKSQPSPKVGKNSILVSYSTDLSRLMS
jgi:hypothetical protein